LADQLVARFVARFSGCLAKRLEQQLAESFCHGYENQQGRTTSLEQRFAMATFGTILGFAVMMTLDVAWAEATWGGRQEEEATWQT
jgi:hypothetical protein